MEEDEMREEEISADRELGSWCITEREDLIDLLENRDIAVVKELTLKIDVDDLESLSSLLLDVSKLWIIGSEIRKFNQLNLFPNVEELVINGTNIQGGLQGLNNFTSIKKIMITDNKFLTSIDDHIKSRSLNSITIGNNHLDRLPFLDSPSLETLIFARVQIVDLGVALARVDSKMIRLLMINSCQVKTIGKINTLRSLKSLSMQENNLSDLNGIESFPNLQFLEVCGNPIRDISSLSKLHSLKYLSIDAAAVERHPEVIKKYNLRKDRSNCYTTDINNQDKV